MHKPKFTIALSALLLAGIVVCSRAPQVVSAADAAGTIERLDPALDALISPTTQVEKVAGGFKFLDGEIWVASQHVLWVSDLVSNVLSQVTPDGKVSDVLNPGGYDGHDLPAGGYVGPNGMAPGPNGTITVCQHGNRRIVSVNPETKKVTMLVDSWEGKKLNSPNDVVYGPDGALYFTDPPYGLPKGNTDPAKEIPFNGVFRFYKGKTTAVVQDYPSPNGIAFSPDYKYLYLTNAAGNSRKWMRCDVGADGAANNCALFADASASTDKGTTDGMKIDSAGNLYASGPGGMWVISPAGKHLGTIRTPEGATNGAWGDDGKTLYITARTSVYKVRVNVAGETAFYNK